MRKFKHLKEYKVFEQEEFDFDELANIGLFKKVITHIVQLHESTIHNNNLISTNSKFLDDLSKLISESVIKIKQEKSVDEQDFLKLIFRWEELLYKSSKLHSVENSLYSCLEDELFSLKSALKDEIDTEQYQEYCDILLKKKANEIVVQNDDYNDDYKSVDIKLVDNDNDEYAELNDLQNADLDSKQALSKLTKIFEKKFKKKFDFFTLTDKLAALDWFEKMPSLKEVSEEDRESILEVIREFLGL